MELIYVQESEEKAKNIKNIITRHGYDNIMMCTKMPTNNQNCTVIQCTLTVCNRSTLVIQEKLMFRGREEIVPPGIKFCPVMSSDYSKPVKLGQ
ncbi:unnamed protein product [Brassica rapa]|uniref:Uncharacterized protein n=2 Tax=Brassica TaxID=3705 RepID=A0A8D9FYF9_BRACM|nr:unnamed protein product [Brassica napus]CAG7862303.1 unnamed protein product [Brassica rapa]